MHHLCEFLIANQANGRQRSVKVDDENKWGKLIDYRIGQEFEASILGEEYAGYILKITGGMDLNGFGMKQGIFKAGRTRLLLAEGQVGFNCLRDGVRRRKSVRGCIVGRDIGTLHTVIVKKGDQEIKDFTDVEEPRRLGPKRANRIRKFFGLPKHSDNIGKADAEKVDVDRFDVTRYVVRRTTKEVEGKSYFKAPRIQRLVTSKRFRRKTHKRNLKIAGVQNTQRLYKEYLDRVEKK